MARKKAEEISSKSELKQFNFLVREGDSEIYWNSLLITTKLKSICPNWYKEGNTYYEKIENYESEDQFIQEIWKVVTHQGIDEAIRLLQDLPQETIYQIWYPEKVECLVTSGRILPSNMKLVNDEYLKYYRS